MTDVTIPNLEADIKQIVGKHPFFSGDEEIGQGTISTMIEFASRIFSNYKPLEVVEDEVGDGGNYYPVTNLSSWENDFSEILQVDYDVGSRVTSDELPQFLNIDDGDVQFYRDATTRYFVFPNHGPTSSITFRVTYTALHLIGEEVIDSLSTIPNIFRNAITYLAISELNNVIQQHMESGIDGPRGVEFTTFRNKGSGFDRLMQVYFDKFLREIGGADGVAAASKTRDFDQTFATGDRYFFHNSSRQ